MSERIRDWQRAIGVKVDGDFGPATLAASMALLEPSRPELLSTAYPRQHQDALVAFYGPAGSSACTMGRVTLPFAFPLAWDAEQKVTRFSCHVKVEAALTSILTEAAAHYGEVRFRQLRLDRYGGCYSYRTMRRGSALSMHAWGIALDLDPENNQLDWGKDRASFARPEYEPWWKIVEAHGATSLGRARNCDWMHFQFASL